MDGAKGGVLYCGWRRERYKMLPWSAGLRSGDTDVCAVLHSVIIGADKSSAEKPIFNSAYNATLCNTAVGNFKERRKMLN